MVRIHSEQAIMQAEVQTGSNKGRLNMKLPLHRRINEMDTKSMRKLCTLAFLLILGITACAGSGQTSATDPSDGSENPPGEVISFTTLEGIQLSGTLFGEGEFAVVLAHQGTYGADQTTWQPFAQMLAENGFTALTFDFRGRGQSEGPQQTGGLMYDVNAAIEVLRERGHEEIACIGASMGGTSCLRAALDQELSGLVVIASTFSVGDPTSVAPVEMAGLELPTLFIVASYDYTGVVSDTTEMYERATAPKQLRIFKRYEHGTHLFDTEVGGEMESLLYGFLDSLREDSSGSSHRIAELMGTSGPIYNLDLSSDGSMLVSAGYSQLKIWDTESLQERATLEGHESYVWDVSWSPNDQYLASASQDGTVRLWDASNFQQIATLESGWAFSVAWSPDSRYLAVGKAQDGVEIWQIENLSEITSLPADSKVISLSWSGDGRRLAAGLLNGEVLIWDTGNWTLLHTLSSSLDDRSDANGVAWSPDSQILASAHQDGRIRIWDAETGQMRRSLQGHTGWVRGIAWTPDGLRLASSGEDTSVRIWEPSTGAQTTAIAGGVMPVWSVVWSHDGRQVFAGEGSYDDASSESSIWLLDMP